MSPLTKSDLASDYDQFWLNVRLHPNKVFLREARIYRELLISLLWYFMQLHQDFSCRITHSEYGTKVRTFLDYSIELTYKGNQGDSETRCREFFEEFAKFVQTHQDVIPREYRLLYDAFLWSVNVGAIKISRDSITAISDEEYDKNMLAPTEKIGFPQPIDKYFEFVNLLKEKIERIISPQ